MIQSSVFKSYDVRGIYPEELNEESAFAIGSAFVKHTGAKSIVVGYDARISSPALFKSLTDGLFAEGAKVHNISQVPTECLYFAVGSYDFEAGIMITASHNPKEYNGFKMIVKKGNRIEMVRGKDLFEFIDKSSYSHAPVYGSSVPVKDILPDYINFILKFSAHPHEVSGYDHSVEMSGKIVVDASNGVIGNVISKTKDKLPIKVIDLNFEPDGNFPNHSPNPLDPGASQQIAEKIKQEKADFGFMFDGDADRVFLVDERGDLVSADITLLLLAKHFLNKNPGSAIAYNAICSKVVPEFVKKWGGVPIRTQVGFVNVRESLMKNNGVMGGELSGHYCFKDYFYMDSGVIAFLTLLQVISQESRKVSEIIKELSPYFKSVESNFKIENKETILERIKEKYSDGKQDFLDGVTIEYKNWWFNIRPSNTESLLRLTIEADTQDLLERKKKELSEFILK